MTLTLTLDHLENHIVRFASSTSIHITIVHMASTVLGSLRSYGSNSARVATILFTIGQFNVIYYSMLAGQKLTADYLNRHHAECTHKSCQICTFVNHLAEIPVCAVSVQDVVKIGL